MAQRLEMISPTHRVRHELKYIIPAQKAVELRNYISICCDHDPFATGDPPVYRVSTMQLDSPQAVVSYGEGQKAG